MWNSCKRAVPKHSRMRTALMKEDTETDVGKKTRVSMERSNKGTKKKPKLGF